MPATGQDLTIWQGDTKVLAIPVDDGGNPPLPVDLTGACARWWAAKSAEPKNPSEIFIEKGTAFGTASITFDADTGFWNVIVPLNSPDTQTIPKGKWYHECEVIDAGGAVARVSLGKFNINPSLIPASLGCNG